MLQCSVTSAHQKVAYSFDYSVYQGVRNVGFSESFPYVINE